MLLNWLTWLSDRPRPAPETSHRERLYVGLAAPRACDVVLLNWLTWLSNRRIRPAPETSQRERLYVGLPPSLVTWCS